MAWTIAITLAILTLAGILLIVNKSLDNSKQGIKVFLTMFFLATLVVMSQVGKSIIEVKASGSQYTTLSLLSTTHLVLTIGVFGFFIMFFLVNYTKGVLKAVKDSKKEKTEFDWGADFI